MTLEPLDLQLELVDCLHPLPHIILHAPTIFDEIFMESILPTRHPVSFQVYRRSRESVRMIALITTEIRKSYDIVSVFQ